MSLAGVHPRTVQVQLEHVKTEGECGPVWSPSDSSPWLLWSETLWRQACLGREVQRLFLGAVWAVVAKRRKQRLVLLYKTEGEYRECNWPCKGASGCVWASPVQWWTHTRLQSLPPCYYWGGFGCFYHPWSHCSDSLWWGVCKGVWKYPDQVPLLPTTFNARSWCFDEMDCQ